MKPTLSVIFSTVLSSAGLGLAVWTLIASTMSQHIRMDAPTFYKAIGIAVVLAAFGLWSLAFHFANRKNTIDAVTRWKTSWWSLAGTFALLFFPLIALHLYVIHRGHVALAPITLTLTIACVFATLFCTSMIYAQMKTVPRWHTWMTPAKHVIFGLASGAVLFTAALSLRPVEFGPLGRPMMALVFLALSVALYLAYLMKHPSAKHSIKDARGVNAGRVRPLDAGHPHGTFLPDEFGFELASDHAHLVRWLAIIWAFIMPFVLLAFTRWYWVATVFCIAGMLLGRWLFFAKAEHVALPR